MQPETAFLARNARLRITKDWNNGPLLVGLGLGAHQDLVSGTHGISKPVTIVKCQGMIGNSLVQGLRV
jgi:hypothetical protein